MKKTFSLALAGLLSVSLLSAAVLDGKKVYGAKCAVCHGLDGKGKPALAKSKKLDPAALDLTKEATVKKPLADLVKATSDGTGKMTGMKSKMTAEEINAAVQYMLTLGAPAKK